MLRELVVEDLGVIERAELELEGGSSALTGETGAGKTLLVSAMALLLGGRADRSLVRHGASEARVEARFDVQRDHPAAELLRGNGLLDDDEHEIVVVRTVSDGGGKVRINGRLATVSALVELGPLLVEIAGQHEHQRLTSRKEQMRLLDAYAGPSAVELAGEVQQRVRLAKATRRREAELRAGERELERELDVLRYEIEEIEGASPRDGEAAELRLEADRREHAEVITAAISRARHALEAEAGAIDRVREAARDAVSVVERDPALAALAQRLESAAIELDDVSRELGTRLPTIDDAALEDIRERLGVLARLERKYGDGDGDVSRYLASARARVGELEGASFDAERVSAEAADHERHARAAAEKLSGLRRDAAARMSSEVGRILGSLAMGDTTIEVALEPAELHEGGLENVELRVAAPGHRPRPLAKVASGGELSRIALALRLASGASPGSADTLIFDEVDAGVGGEAARAVGRCLADLARDAGAQVLVVTHLPQVAAFADAHHRVRKMAAGASTTAVVERLSGDDRVAELARMLAGLPGSERGRRHAQELLEIAAAS
ncbi:MAG: DNA repair protein RecN [Actinobacteria bacterium]|nr:DNA repair protein RecN [Actinomycetota bacterium]